MATSKQIAANRANAKNSTGPRSAEGKARSAQNALKHGVLSEVAVAEHEDERLFLALKAQLMAEHSPETATELLLVEKLTILFWRERRLARAEAFETKAARSNVEFELKMEKQADGAFVINRLPEHFRALDDVLTIETQLLVGRYQTMLSNQIVQTLLTLRTEQALRLNRE